MMKKGSFLLLAALTGCSAGEDNSLVSKTPFPAFTEVDTGGPDVYKRQRFSTVDSRFRTAAGSMGESSLTGEGNIHREVEVLR